MGADNSDSTILHFFVSNVNMGLVAHCFKIARIVNTGLVAHCFKIEMIVISASLHKVFKELFQGVMLFDKMVINVNKGHAAQDFKI